jgi:aerobic carbon-monoxide dehydrogenase large subunit
VVEWVADIGDWLGVAGGDARINPMIVEGQVHGGLTDGVGIALMERSRSTRAATA